MKAKKTPTRQESDSLGTLAVPRDAYYGIHTLRARQNFYVMNQPNDERLIKNYLLIKQAAAKANLAAKRFKKPAVAQAIIAACQDLLAHFDEYRDEFFLPAIQGGAGTSTNMNVNEVVCNKALVLLGRQKGDYQAINPNDDVNMGQSTNDTYPTAGHLTMMDYTVELIAQVKSIVKTLQSLAQKHQTTLKLGRTQLEDAIPTTFGRSFKAYAAMFERDVARLTAANDALRAVPLGGTAIGTGLTASRQYIDTVVDYLNELTSHSLVQSNDLVDGIQNNDCYVHLANSYKTLAVNLSKMANDLRLLNSGPKAGLGEISLPKRQAGSSIMPGKVNPVICEVCSQVAFQVMGHTQTVTLAAEAGQLELNAFEPVAFYNLFNDAKMLTNALHAMQHLCLDGLVVNEKQCLQYVQNAPEIATALSPVLGYEKTCQLIKQANASNQPIKQLLLQYLDAAEIDHLLSPAAFFVAK